METQLTIKEVAARLGVHPNTVHKWVQQGDIKGWRVRRGRWRIQESELEEFIQRETERADPSE